MSTTLSPGRTKCFFTSANLLDSLEKPPFWWRDQFSGKPTHYYFHQLLYILKVNYASS